MPSRIPFFASGNVTTSDVVGGFDAAADATKGTGVGEIAKAGAAGAAAGAGAFATAATELVTLAPAAAAEVAGALGVAATAEGIGAALGPIGAIVGAVVALCIAFGGAATGDVGPYWSESVQQLQADLLNDMVTYLTTGFINPSTGHTQPPGKAGPLTLECFAKDAGLLDAVKSSMLSVTWDPFFAWLQALEAGTTTSNKIAKKYKLTAIQYFCAFVQRLHGAANASGATGYADENHRYMAIADALFGAAIPGPLMYQSLVDFLSKGSPTMNKRSFAQTNQQDLDRGMTHYILEKSTGTIAAMNDLQYLNCLRCAFGTPTSPGEALPWALEPNGLTVNGRSGLSLTQAQKEACDHYFLTGEVPDLTDRQEYDVQTLATDGKAGHPKVVNALALAGKPLAIVGFVANGKLNVTAPRPLTKPTSTGTYVAAGVGALAVAGIAAAVILL